MNRCLASKSVANAIILLVSLLVASCDTFHWTELRISALGTREDTVNFGSPTSRTTIVLKIGRAHV